MIRFTGISLSSIRETNTRNKIKSAELYSHPVDNAVRRLNKNKLVSSVSYFRPSYLYKLLFIRRISRLSNHKNSVNLLTFEGTLNFQSTERLTSTSFFYFLLVFPIPFFPILSLIPPAFTRMTNTTSNLILSC